MHDAVTDGDHRAALQGAFEPADDLAEGGSVVGRRAAALPGLFGDLPAGGVLGGEARRGADAFDLPGVALGERSVGHREGGELQRGRAGVEHEDDAVHHATSACTRLWPVFCQWL